MVGNEKAQCLSSIGLPEESETHPDIIPSAIIEGVMSIPNMGAFFLGHPVQLQNNGNDIQKRYDVKLCLCSNEELVLV